MNYLSYGHECIVYLLATMLVSHLVLDLFPPVLRRLGKVFVIAPVPASAAFILLVSAYFFF